MLRRILGMSVALLVLAAGQALAEPTDYGHAGGYVGVGGGYAWNVGDLPDEIMFDSGAVSGWLGYRIDKLASIELQGEWLNGMKDINGFTIIANLNWYPLSYYRPGGFLQPFFVTGAGIMVAKLPGRGTALNGAFRLGGGLDAYLSEHWSVRIKGEWVTGVGRLNDIAYTPITLGVQYNW